MPEGSAMGEYQSLLKALVMRVEWKHWGIGWVLGRLVGFYRYQRVDKQSPHRDRCNFNTNGEGNTFWGL